MRGKIPTRSFAFNFSLDVATDLVGDVAKATFMDKRLALSFFHRKPNVPQPTKFGAVSFNLVDFISTGALLPFPLPSDSSQTPTAPTSSRRAVPSPSSSTCRPKRARSFRVSSSSTWRACVGRRATPSRARSGTRARSSIALKST